MRLWDFRDQDKLHLAAGEALIQWSGVEFQAYAMFHRHCGMGGSTADAVWGTVVSLDAKLTVLQRLLTRLHPEGELHGDIVLLLNEVRKRYRQRNEIAHSTLVFEEGIKPALEPFLLITKDSPRLLTENIEQYGKHFAALSWAMTWLNQELLWKALHPTPQTASPRQPPDLVLALRDEESRRRREQSERSRLLRHALKLAAEGRLPDWPPHVGSVVQRSPS